jgi:hypothetical protein
MAGWGRDAARGATAVGLHRVAGCAGARCGTLGGYADLLLLMLGGLALRLNPVFGSQRRFLARGYCTPACWIKTVGSLIISRMVAAFAVAWLPILLDRQHLLSACLACALMVLLANLLLYLAAPSITGWEWWRATGGTMVYNTILAAPVYGLLGRVLPRYQEAIR